MTGKTTLYFTAGSPPARSTLLLIRYLNIDVDVKKVNLLGKEQHSEEFKKLNPVSKVPVFVDSDGFTLSESRAILGYLVNTRKPGSDLYPSDPKKRALVDQRLYYDATVVFGAVISLVRPIIYFGAKTVSQTLIDELTAIIKMLESFLSDSEYFAGDKMTIADISILASLTTFAEFNFDFTEYPKLSAWYKKMQTIPGFEENKAGAKFLAGIIAERLGKSLF